MRIQDIIFALIFTTILSFLFDVTLKEFIVIELLIYISLGVDRIYKRKGDK